MKNNLSSGQTIFYLILLGIFIYLLVTAKGGECDAECQLEQEDEAYYERIYRGAP